MKCILSILCVALGVVSVAAPATAQKLGAGGTGVDGATSVPTCPRPLGSVALVEDKAPADPQLDALPPQLRAMYALAQGQQGGQAVDPLPLLKLLVARSQCFTVVDRGAGFDAIQRERALAAGNYGQQAPNPALQAADFMLVAQVVYANANARQSGGGVGSLLGGSVFGGMGLQQKTREVQTLLTLTSVKTGVQEAVASGEARKKDLGIMAGGLSGLGVGALGGTYESTDMGKITALALLDGFRKLVFEAQDRISVK